MILIVLYMFLIYSVAQVIPRLTGLKSPVFSHPWQLMPPMRNSRNWKASDEEEFFLRHKRRPISHTNEQLTDSQMDDEVSTVSSTNEDFKTRLNVGGSPILRNFGWDPNFQGFRNNGNSVPRVDRNKLLNKFWNAVYNPLPYGGPRSLQSSVEEADVTFRQKQASGLPVARTASREKEPEKPELRLPIPDSEIPSPGHYRQPVNESLLQASNNLQIRPKLPVVNSTTSNPLERPVNVEAFRILMEIIRSLRNMDVYSTTTSPLLSGDNKSRILP